MRKERTRTTHRTLHSTGVIRVVSETESLHSVAEGGPRALDEPLGPPSSDGVLLRRDGVRPHN